MTEPDPAQRRALTSLLAFWAEAGVDCAYADAPVDRLAPRPPPAPRLASAPAAPTPRAPAIAAPAGSAASLPAGPSLDAAREAAAGAADLPALVAAWAAHASPAAGVPPELVLHGPADPLVAWIGSAPDSEEAAEGRLLAGAAGRLTARILRAAGLEGRVLVLNTALQGAPGGGGPAVADQARSLPFLERALQLAAPRAAVLAGAGAVAAVTGAQAPILKLHGRATAWTGPHFGVALPMLPTFSTHALLAQPALKARAWRDILALLALVDSLTTPP